MKLSDESLNEFIRIYKEEYGADLTRSEASEMTSRLLTFYELLATKQKDMAPAAPKSPEEPPRSIGFLRSL